MMRFAMLSTSYTGSINYHYNSRDLLAQIINGRGQQRELEYDAANRLVSITDVDGTTSFTYDNNGNILTVKDNQGTITRTYDALNRVTSYTDVNGNTIQYEYDSIGNLATLIYPDGKQVHYDYNAVNQLIKVTDWKGRITQYQYDANGRLLKTLRPNDTQQLRNYDVKGQLLQQQDVINQTIITQFDYRYDAVGNIIEETKQPVNIVPNLQLEMTYAPANQLATVNQQAVELDADGNMVNGILKGQLTQFNFDSRNRLIQAGDTIYRYDAENQRIAVNQTQFVVNPQPALSQVLVRTKGNGEVTYYVYGLGLIGEESTGNYFSYHFDYRGSTVALTDETGQVVDRIAYSAYGELLTQPTHNTPFLFNGMYGVMSDDNGLYYMRARFYSPEIKRFVNQDVLLGSIIEGQTLNRFTFVTGNPVSSVDPLGLFDWGKFGVGGRVTNNTLFYIIAAKWEKPINFWIIPPDSTTNFSTDVDFIIHIQEGGGISVFKIKGVSHTIFLDSDPFGLYENGNHFSIQPVLYTPFSKHAEERSFLLKDLVKFDLGMLDNVYAKNYQQCISVDIENPVSAQAYSYP